MNLDELHRKLIAAARRNAPADHVPYAFEKRVAAILQTRPAQDLWALWARSLWRGAAACLAVMLLLGAISFFMPARTASTSEMSEEFENTMLAAVDTEPDAQ